MKKFLFCLLSLANFMGSNLCVAMVNEEDNNSTSLRIVQGKSIDELQQMGAIVSFPLLQNTLGNMLNLQEGVLKVTCPSSDQEEAVLQFYKDLNNHIKTGYVIGGPFKVDAPTQSHVGAKCVGKSSLELSAYDNFTAEQALFGSNGKIDFIGRKFNLKTSFIDVNIQHGCYFLSPCEP